MSYPLAGTLLQGSLILYLLGALVALGLMQWPRVCNLIVNIIAGIASALAVGASLLILLKDTGPVQVLDWTASLPFIVIQLRLDALSAFFLLSLSLLVISISIYSLGYLKHYVGQRNVGLFHFLYMTFIISMILVFTSANGLIFFISWEAMSLLSYFLVVFEGEKEENQRAGTLYLTMTHAATAFLLIAWLVIYSYTGSVDLATDGALIPPEVKNLLFVFFLVGFGTKAGLIPVHIWLPQAHPAAPSNVSALMSGIMIKTAVYGLIRWVMVYLGVESLWWGVALLAFGTISLVLGISYAFLEKNIKRLLAFSSVENMGLIFIGLGTAFLALAQDHPALASLALAAALVHSFNHSLFKGGLFLAAGSIQYATHTKEIDQLGGLLKKMPGTGLLALMFSLAISAILPFNGFISEWLTLQALFGSILPDQIGVDLLLILAVAGIGLAGALAVATFVKFFGIAFLGLPRSEQASRAQEVPLSMNIGMAVLAAGSLLLGIFPRLLLALTDSVAERSLGFTVGDQLQGGLFVLTVPFQAGEIQISPLLFACLFLIGMVLILLVVRLLGGPPQTRRYGTWDCGFEGLSPRMQYTAEGYANPLSIVFRFLFRPKRRVATKGTSPYHPRSIVYSVVFVSVFEEYIYQPLFKIFTDLSRRAKYTIQTGSIHNYLWYIFLMVLLFILYYRFV